MQQKRGKKIQTVLKMCQQVSKSVNKCQKGTKRPKKGDFIISVLPSANVERVSITHMHV